MGLGGSRQARLGKIRKVRSGWARSGRAGKVRFVEAGFVEAGQGRLFKRNNHTRLLDDKIPIVVYVN